MAHVTVLAEWGTSKSYLRGLLRGSSQSETGSSDSSVHSTDYWKVPLPERPGHTGLSADCSRIPSCPVCAPQSFNSLCCPIGWGLVVRPQAESSRADLFPLCPSRCKARGPLPPSTLLWHDGIFSRHGKGPKQRRRVVSTSLGLDVPRFSEMWCV